MLTVQARHMLTGEAAALHAELEASGAQVNANVLLELVRAYGMTGRAKEAEQAFALYTQRTSPRDQAYEVLLTALCRAGAPHAALKHAQIALETAIPLSDNTVAALIQLLQPHIDLRDKFAQLLRQPRT